MNNGKPNSKRRGRLSRRLGIVACALVAVVALIGVLGISPSDGNRQIETRLAVQTNQTTSSAESATSASSETAQTVAQTDAQEENAADGAQVITVQPSDASATGAADANSNATAPADTTVQAEVTPAEFKERLATLPDTVSLDTDAEVAPEQAEHEEDTVLLEVSPGISAEDLNAMLAKVDFVTTKDVSDQDLSIGLVELNLAPGTDVARAAYTLQETGLTGNAQPNYIYHLLDNDLAAAALESANVNDLDIDKQWALEKIQAYDAWDVVKTNKTVTVAILDNGCIADHEDLHDNIVATYNAVNDSTDVSHVTSSYHGTHVAGIVSAVSNNQTGISGVSYNAGLLPIQVFENDNGKEGASTTTLVKAYTYIINNAASKKIKVVNMSLGAVISSTDKSVENKISEAYNRGIITVCAAGNNNLATPPYKCFPVDYSDCIVGVINLEQSTDENSNPGVSVAPSSNYNMAGQTTKDISAPGSKIYSTYGSGTSTYANSTGTSMAAPHVAGILALEFAADPNLTASEAVDALYAGATDLETDGWDEHTGWGMANAYGALKAIEVNLIGNSVVPRGSSIQLSPSKYKSATWTWASSDSAVATVDSNGNVTGLETGTVTITATYGTVRAEKEVTVYTASFTGPSILLKGSSPTFSIDSSLSGNWVLRTSNSNVATATITTTFTSGGAIRSIHVNGIGAGTATITATNAAYGVSVDATVTVYDTKIVNTQGVSNGIGVLKDGSDILSVQGGPPGTTWSWSSSDPSVCTVDETTGFIKGISTGTSISASSTITATATLGNYTYMVSTSVSVGANEISESTTTVTLSEDSFTYDPSISAYGPSSITVTCNGSALQNKFYSVSYADNDRAGTATVTITGRRGYVGSVVKTFTIAPAPISQLATIGNILEQTYTGNDLQPTPSVSVTITSSFGPFVYSTLHSLESGTDYTVSYKNNKNAGTATVTITGKGNYTGSKTQTFTIKQAAISSATISSIGTQAYNNGKEITPVPTISFGGKNLKQGTDYTLSYKNNRNAGTATVTATGKGNYAGTVSKSFVIAKTSIANASLSSIAQQAYTGSAITPTPSVTLNGTTLVKDTDYTLSYMNNVNAGTATVTVAGKGNYSGTRSTTFKIVRKSISSASISSIANRTFNGKAQTPAPRVTVNGVTLVKGTDYTLSYKNNVNAGTATVTVIGKGNYTGSKKATFTIAKAANTMKVATTTKSVKRSKVKKRKQVVSNCITFTTAAQGSVTYAKVAKGSSGKLSIDANTGQITVKKGTKKGTYKIKVRVTASGNANYASRSHTVTAKIRVK